MINTEKNSRMVGPAGLEPATRPYERLGSLGTTDSNCIFPFC